MSARSAPDDDGPPEIRPRPFRGSDAVVAGRIAWSTLRGPRFDRLAPDVYVETGHELDLRHRAVAASVWGGPGAVVAGWGATALWDLDVAPRDAGVDLLADRVHRSPTPWISSRRDRLGDDDVRARHDVEVTSPLRTAVDLARWYPVVDAVAGADGLARWWAVTGDALLDYADTHPGIPGIRAVRRVAGLLDAGADSPPETRMRLIIVFGGLPRPVSQHPVSFPGGGWAKLDLAWPEVKVALEYDGEEHRSIARHGRDLERDAMLAELGWLVIRVTDRQLRDPAALRRRVARAIASRA